MTDFDLDLGIDDGGGPGAAQRDQPRQRRAAAAGLALVGLLLSGVVLGAFVQYRRLLDDTAAESHTLQVLNHLEGLFANVLDAQNARRGFVITADRELLPIFESSIARAKQNVAAVETLTSDNRQQSGRIAALRPYLEEFFEELQTSIHHRQEAAAIDELQIALTRRGDLLLKELRLRIAALVDEETRLLALRRTAAHRSSRRASIVLAAGALLALLLVAALAAAIFHEDRRRRRAELSLRTGLRFLDEVIEALPVLTAIKDARDLRYVRLNRAGADLLGVSASDFVGKSAADLFPADQAALIEAQDRQALTSALPLDLPPSTVSGRNGDLLFHSRKTTIKDAGGNARYLLTVSEDVTNQVASAKEISRLNLELESSLASALVANRELEAFAYSVSHDLRAPLRAAHSFAIILRDEHAGGLDAEGRRLLDVVVRSASSMGELIDDLLDLSRLSRQEMRDEAVDVAALVRGVLADLELQGLVGASSVTIGDLPNVRGDAGLLRHAFYNLLSNAFKYSRRSSPPTIALTACTRDEDHLFTLRDNGVGFDMKYVDRLFIVFERLHSASEYEGTGVGLALVKRIIERHGGTIWADAAVGKGAVFSFTLPRRLEQRT